MSTADAMRAQLDELAKQIARSAHPNADQWAARLVELRAMVDELDEQDAN